MVYSIAIRQHPSRIVATGHSIHGHVCGGECTWVGLPRSARFVQIMSLSLADPALSFLRLTGIQRLPLIMDTASGVISYSLREGEQIVLHGEISEGEESVLEGPLPVQALEIVPFTYEQYRAAWFGTAVIDRQFLSEADRNAEASLGESYSQIGGAHALGMDWSPYCDNPECPGYQTSTTTLLASISQSLSDAVFLACWPNDPALQFFLCTTCHAIHGSVSV